MSKKAFYHQHGREPLELNVVNTNADGTVDLGHSEDGEIVVRNCVVGVEAVPGTATLPLEAKPAVPKPARKRRGAAADAQGADQAGESGGEDEEPEGEGEQTEDQQSSESATES